MAYRDKTSTKIKGAILSVLVKLAYRLPAPITYWISLLFSRLNFALNGKATRIMRANLQICYPELKAQQINQEILSVNRQSAHLFNELITAWFADRAKLESHIQQVHNQALINEIVEKQGSVIIAVAHIGNWEYLWQWIQLNYPAFGMYQPAKFEQLDKIIFESRTKFGGKAFSTDPRGIMGLLRELKKGGVMMILPDQAPREGAGIYSPFFGQPAYTMTLLHKLLSKSQANLLFGNCIRNKDGSFDIYLEKPQFDYSNRSVEEFNQQMNQQLESIINKWKEQYQWSYKRFKRQPEGKSLYS